VAAVRAGGADVAAGSRADHEGLGRQGSRRSKHPSKLLTDPKQHRLRRGLGVRSDDTGPCRAPVKPATESVARYAGSSFKDRRPVLASNKEENLTDKDHRELCGRADRLPVLDEPATCQARTFLSLPYAKPRNAMG